MAEHINAATYDQTGCAECWPSVARLVTETGLLDRTVKRARRKAQALGIITAVSPQTGGRHKMVKFEFSVPWIDAALAKKKVDMAAKTPAETVTETVTSVSPFRAAETVTPVSRNSDTGGPETVTPVSPESLEESLEEPLEATGATLGTASGSGEGDAAKEVSVRNTVPAQPSSAHPTTVPAQPSFANPNTVPAQLAFASAKAEVKSNVAWWRPQAARLYGDHTTQKQRWEQKVCIEVIQRYGPEKGMAIIESYQRGDPEGKRVFNLTNLAMRQNEPPRR
jgi:hypothetical protein